MMKLEWTINATNTDFSYATASFNNIKFEIHGYVQTNNYDITIKRDEVIICEMFIYAPNTKMACEVAEHKFVLFINQQIDYWNQLSCSWHKILGE